MMDPTKLDCFRLCKCLKILGNVMILMVLGLVGLSYFAVAYCYLGPLAPGGSGPVAGSICVMLLFTILAVMLIWSYFATVFCTPGHVPEGWHPFSTEQEGEQEQHRISQGIPPASSTDPVTRPRWCRKCQCWKPQRAHHCSVTNTCVLKMDHYCIWVVNTVGLLNYKFFLLFLFYTGLASLVACMLLLPQFITFFKLDHTGGGLPEGSAVAVVFIAFIIDVAFTVSLSAFCLMHGKMVSCNQTTIEMYEKAPLDPWPHDRGLMGNWKEVFGREPYLWLLPMHSPRHRDHLLHQALHPYLANEPTIPSHAPDQQQSDSASPSQRYLAPSESSTAAPPV